ncbi:MAG: hypothetical protein ACREMN_13425 [Gemmatimonadales bacterium]
MRGRLTLLLVALLLPRTARTQDSTALQLARARQLYEQLELERAAPLLRQVLSAGWPHDVTPAQRVEAYTYLGAALVLAGRRDSALAMFRALLERDAFADLDVAQFTPAQLAVFQNARRQVFRAGARPPGAARIDPRTEPVVFTIVTTHDADLQVEIQPVAGGGSRTVFGGPSQGLRQVGWDVTLGDGRLAPPGRYVLSVRAESRLLDRRDSVAVYFDLGHEHPPLEDTLPDLAARDLLPERRTGSDAANDLLKGVGVGAGAWLLAHVIGRGELDPGKGLALVIVGAGGIVGGTAYFSRRNREIPANVAVNQQRRTARRAANDAIQRRNAERIAQTMVTVRPAAGAGP